MYVNDGFSCCGIRELSELRDRDVKDNIKSFMDDYFQTDTSDSCGEPSYAAHIIFTQAGKQNKYGERFKAFIVKHGLGEVIETEWKKNPNSGNQLKAFIWTMDHKAIKAYGKENGYGPGSEGEEDPNDEIGRNPVGRRGRAARAVPVGRFVLPSGISNS